MQKVIKVIIYITVLMQSQIEALTKEQLDRDKFYKEALETVNYIRDLHSAKPLVYGDKRMTDLAEKLASAVVQTLNNDAEIKSPHVPKGITSALANEEFFLDDDETYGHSIAVMEGSDYKKLAQIKGGLAARFWYNTEFPIYDFKNRNEFNKLTSHLSQLIWRSTEKLTVSVDFTNAGDLVIAYIYRKYGNYDTNGQQYQENVKDLKDSKRTFEVFLNDPHLQLFPFDAKKPLDRSFYSYEDYW